VNAPPDFRCWVEIDSGALRHNAEVARERVGGKVNLLAVVKANGYGHGMVQVARALKNDVQLFGVANLQEALELRECGLAHPILILGPALPEERAAIIQHQFIASVSSLDEAQAFDRLTRANSATINFVIDTGMGRMGTWEDDAISELEKVSMLPNVAIHSISTHLPVADEDENFTRMELSRFRQLVRQIRSRVRANYAVHVLLSAGILAFPGESFDIVRAGLMLYGSSPSSGFQELLQPAMTFKSRVALLRNLPQGRSISYGRTFITPRPMRVATLSAGYADGYPRSLSNRDTAVLIRGQRCKVLGRVTMDLTMVDVTEIPGARIGDEAVLMGRQGEEEILASELAQLAGTIAWEIFTGIGSRVRRVYL
jgi:alanine racemase